MKNSRQKKNAYPNCVKTMFRAGCDKYNDYDTGEMRIRHDPFRVVKIPPKNIADKKALPVDVLRRFFDVDITSLKPSKRVCHQEHISPKMYHCWCFAWLE